RLPEQPGQCVPTILATACVGQNITRHLGQTEYVVEFAISQQPSIGGHQGAAKLEHQAAVEIEPNSIRSRFTSWVRRRIECDLYYIDNWSFLLDIKIIVMTLFSKRAYTNAV